MEIIFLGTGSMVPTKDRNHSSLLLIYKGEGILFDCGEGTQRQLKIIGIKPTMISKIFISHWHGDHVLGLPGLIQTMGSLGYQGKLQIFGPKGTKKRFGSIGKVFLFEERVDVEVHDIAKPRFLEEPDYYMEALPLEHTASCLGYCLTEKDRRRIRKEAIVKLGIPEGPLLGKLQSGESIKWNNKTVTPDEATYTIKGKKVTYIADTKLCSNAIKLAQDADLLICESTYANALEEKATLYKHLTAGQAGFIANKANAKKLVLTHFSQRYKDLDEVREDAKTVFSNCICANDLMRISL